MLYRADKGFMHVSANELEDVPADPEYKLPLHTQHSHYMWGDGVEINSSQIEAVRMWQGLLPIDSIAQRKADQ